MVRRLVLVAVCLVFATPLYAADNALVVDLSRCEIDGQPMEWLLRWTTADTLATSPRVQTFARVQSKGFLSQVYLGVCSVDGAHGQSAVINLKNPDANDMRRNPSIVPALRGGMGREAVESLLGPPGSDYRTLLLSGNRKGLVADWQALCPGFTVRLRFDDDAQLQEL